MAEKSAADLEKEARAIKKELEILESRLSSKMTELKTTALEEQKEVSLDEAYKVLMAAKEDCTICHGGCTVTSSPGPCDGSCITCLAY